VKVLIAYTTKKGSTREVAERIGEVLQAKGIEVKVADIKDKPKVEGYDAAIVGAPIMMGSLLHRAPKFVKKHLAYLQDKPFACFALGGTLAEDTEENRAIMLKKLAKITDKIKPVDIGLFGGRYDDERDYRDWDKIKAWAEGLAGKLK
jgi:menaquinone-dependent protoporphyrinogen oxidase